VLTVFLSIPLIRRVSRRHMLFLGLSVMSLGMLLMCVSTHFFYSARAIPSILSILLVVLGFEIGPGPLFFILASEAFPPPILHAGLSLANQLAWVCNIAITFLFPVMTAQIGTAATFGVFFLLCVGSIIGYYFLLPPATEDAEIVQPSPSTGADSQPNFGQDWPADEEEEELARAQMEEQMVGDVEAQMPMRHHKKGSGVELAPSPPPMLLTHSASPPHSAQQQFAADWQEAAAARPPFPSHRQSI
jgi:MFS family permease